MFRGRKNQARLYFFDCCRRNLLSLSITRPLNPWNHPEICANFSSSSPLLEIEARWFHFSFFAWCLCQFSFFFLMGSITFKAADNNFLIEYCNGIGFNSRALFVSSCSKRKQTRSKPDETTHPCQDAGFEVSLFVGFLGFATISITRLLITNFCMNSNYRVRHFCFIASRMRNELGTKKLSWSKSNIFYKWMCEQKDKKVEDHQRRFWNSPTANTCSRGSRRIRRINFMSLSLMAAQNISRDWKIASPAGATAAAARAEIFPKCQVILRRCRTSQLYQHPR